jgi:tRNA (guanine37-N1)-methyltransferase
MLRIDYITLFPEVIQASVTHSIMRRAAEGGHFEWACTNPRDYCYDRHQKVDDTPFGGAAGMLIRAEPVALALESIGFREGKGDAGSTIILTDPTGERFDQRLAEELGNQDRLVFLCGHYEGIDDRISQKFATRSVSIGDFVLTNGELPALVMSDAIVRRLPGVLGSAASLDADSHSDGLLSAPNYTRPEVWREIAIPDVLKSGDHRAIEQWRRSEALKLTKRHRPDLLAKATLDKRDLDVLSS